MVLMMYLLYKLKPDLTCNYLVMMVCVILQVVFTDPYSTPTAEMNRWTSPQLDNIAAEIRGDTELKYAVSLLKAKFIQSAEALIHADLHTGSIMVREQENTMAVALLLAY